MTSQNLAVEKPIVWRRRDVIIRRHLSLFEYSIAHGWDVWSDGVIGFRFCDFAGEVCRIIRTDIGFWIKQKVFTNLALKRLIIANNFIHFSPVACQIMWHSLFWRRGIWLFTSFSRVSVIKFEDIYTQMTRNLRSGLHIGIQKPTVPICHSPTSSLNQSISCMTPKWVRCTHAQCVG